MTDEYRIVATVNDRRHVWDGRRFSQCHPDWNEGMILCTLKQAEEEWPNAMSGFYLTFDSEQDRQAMYVEHRTMVAYGIDCSHLNK